MPNELIPDGWRAELIPLSYGRRRIAITDGQFVQWFW